MNVAKDNFIRYSTLDVKDDERFLCQEMKDDFENVTEVICAFSKKPSSKVEILQNDFFELHSFIQNDTFFISITPLHRIKLIANIFDLTQDDTTFIADVSMAKSWTILGYKDKLPLINERPRPDKSLNFPFFLDKDKLPYVGSLDIKGNPVFIKKVGDVTDYLRVKKLFKEKNYELCLEVIDGIIEEYPHTLFMPELLYYKIKIYSKLKDYDNVIESAKMYLQEYSANENIPEILALTARAYAMIGLNSDADYFFDRLFSEHPRSIFSEWGHIYQAEMIESNGGSSKAIAIYKNIFYNTQHIDVAVTAAFNLAKIELESSPKQAQKYIDEIVKAKPTYFHERSKESKEMMETLVDSEHYLAAARIAGALLDAISPSYDAYEELLSKKALWLAKTSHKQEALQALNRYIKEFPDGDYIEQIEVAKDRLFFDTVSDANATQKLQEYDKLIEEYKNDTIGERAKYEKAKLLLEMHKYQDVLEMKDAIIHLDMDTYKDKEEIIVNAAVGEMQDALKVKECSRVLVIAHDYNITLSHKWDDSLFECAMTGGDYQLSKKIAKKNLKSDDLELRKKWLFRYIKVDFATGNYSEVLSASKDLIALIEDSKNSPYKEIYRYVFDTYNRLEKKDAMLNAIVDIEKVFGQSYKDLDRYVAVMSIGSERNDDNIVITYGEKVFDIQKKSGAHTQSPFVEFALYGAYMNKENYTKALAVISSLDSVELSRSERSRQKYLLGAVLSKLWRNSEADKAYEEAIAADKESPWAKLAQSAKGL